MNALSRNEGHGIKPKSSGRGSRYEVIQSGRIPNSSGSGWWRRTCPRGCKTRHGPDRLGDVVLDLDRDALERWLTDPDAR